MAIETGKQYVPQNAEEIKRDIIDDLYLAARANGIDDPPTQPGTDWDILATALANALLIQYANIAIAEDSADPLSATGDDLDKIREADGLPEVEPSVSAGKVVLSVNGTATVPDGRELRWPNGKRGQVVGTFVGVTDGSEIDVVSIDTGTAMNLRAGEIVRFLSPPLNVEETAEVSTSEPITGGFDAEDDARKRTRILNRRRNKPAGFNWADAREIGLNSSPAIQDIFVYPALGGPASAKIVPVRKFDRDRNTYSRAPSAGTLELLRNELHSEAPTPMEIVVQAPADQDCPIALNLTLPDSTLAGGQGGGWLDADPWPDDSQVATVTTVTSTTQIILDADDATAPIAGQTRIAWWSQVDKRFRVYTVIAQSGSAGAWTLTVDSPMVDSTGESVQAGDYISPGAENIEAYGDTWLDIMEALGPGENTADANRLPRAKRHPYSSEEAFNAITFDQLRRFAEKHPEITDAAYAYSPTTSPTVPATVSTAPNILRPTHFAIYPK